MLLAVGKSSYPQKNHPFKKTLNATLIANAFSYFVGALLITLLVMF